MRHNWVRDIADFAKYGSLKRLTGADLRLGVFWYLTTHADPSKPLVSYLSRPNAYRACEGALFDTLLRLHNEKGDALTLEDIERGFERWQAARINAFAVKVHGRGRATHE